MVETYWKYYDPNSDIPNKMNKRSPFPKAIKRAKKELGNILSPIKRAVQAEIDKLRALTARFMLIKNVLGMEKSKI